MRRLVLLYGLLGGLVIAALQLVEYRWLVVSHSVEIYGAIVAAIFALSVGTLWLLASGLMSVAATSDARTEGADPLDVERWGFAIHGALQTGSLATTFTASQGLLLMHELLHYAAGARAPIVMANVNRTVASPWAFWPDQTDSLAQRDTGWIQYYVESPQEALDTVLQAFRVAEASLLPVLVRMETLRRATIYAVWAKSDREVGTPSPNPQIADELHAKLMDRLRETIRQNKPAAMALFDAGYLDACFKQAGYQAANKAGNGVEAYAMVRKGGQFAANPEIEFALALITIHPRQASHQEHLQKALAGAKDDSLLARNLVKHFGKPGQNLATLRAQTASAKH